MESWTDQGIVLAVRPHGEGGAVVSLLTQEHGRHAGYVHGAHSKAKRSLLEIGTEVCVEWQAKTSDQLGTYRLEQVKSWAGYIVDEPDKLLALLSVCHLCDQSLQEREQHEDLYHGTRALFEMLSQDVWQDVWGEAYVMWEMALLRELGFALDLSRCASGGESTDLAYVSPKTGRAVSLDAGEPYKDKLLPLPAFLQPHTQGSNLVGTRADLLTGLSLTLYFLEHWVFAHHSKGLPEARLRFQDRLRKTVKDV